jgi:hypothetical protein
MVNLPAGTYVGFEDLPFGGSDEDYNDLTFIFTSDTATRLHPRLYSNPAPSFCSAQV